MENLPQKPTKRQVIQRLSSVFALTVVFIFASSYFKKEPIHWEVMLPILGLMAVMFAVIGVIAYRKKAPANNQELKATLNRQGMFFLILAVCGALLLGLSLLVTPDEITLEKFITPVAMMVLAAIGFVQARKIDK